MVERREVVVVGGGPAGAAAAICLATAGREVLLLDRAAFPRDKACAEYTSPEAVTVLRRLGAWEAVQAVGARPLSGIVVHGPRGARWRLEHAMHGMPHPNLVLPRQTVDAALLEHARVRGAEVRERTSVRHVRRDSDGGLALDLADGGGEVRAHLVVGADGVRSVVARDLGLTRPLVWPRRLGLMARFRDAGGPHDRAAMYLGRGGYAGATPTGEGRLTVTLVTGLGPGPRRHAGLDGFVEALVARFPPLADRLTGAYQLGRARGVGPLGHRVAAPHAAGALLVGDAAGFFDPLTGDGIYLALRGAELASEVADAALRAGDCSTARLAAYTRRRAEVFGPKARLASLLQLFVRWPALAEYALRRLETRSGLAERLGAALGDYGPPGPALSPAYLAALLRP
jgi:geranylgeranyl reductase family protein